MDEIEDIKSMVMSTEEWEAFQEGLSPLAIPLPPDDEDSSLALQTTTRDEINMQSPSSPAAQSADAAPPQVSPAHPGIKRGNAPSAHNTPSAMRYKKKHANNNAWGPTSQPHTSGVGVFAAPANAQDEWPALPSAKLQNLLASGVSGPGQPSMLKADNGRKTEARRIIDIKLPRLSALDKPVINRLVPPSAGSSAAVPPEIHQGWLARNDRSGFGRYAAPVTARDVFLDMNSASSSQSAHPPEKISIKAESAENFKARAAQEPPEETSPLAH